MLWFLLKIILAIPLSLVCIVALREIVSHIKIQHYVKQSKKKKNLLVNTKPAVKLMMDTVKGLKEHNDILHVRKTVQTSPQALQADMLVEKDLRSLDSKVHPLSEKCHAEFFKHEMEFCIKEPATNLDVLGLFFRNGDNIQHERGIFKEIFHFDRLKNALPDIRRITRKHVTQLKKRISAQKNGKLSIDIKRDILNYVFEDISSFMLFKDENFKNEFKINGMTFPIVMSKVFTLYMKMAFSMLNSLSFGWA